jgi:hypothetical protein
MNMHADRTSDDKGKSAGNEPARPQGGGSAGFQLVDHRSQSLAQRRLQEMADNSPQALQLQRVQDMAHERHPILQRHKNVYLNTDTDTKKSLEAEGTVEDFQNGTSAGTQGWVGVTKYRARYTIDSEDGEYHDVGSVGPLQNTFTNPEAGHVLGRQNGGNGGDPENIFAQDGGTNNGTYKAFEIDMRSTMNKYEDDDAVFFKAYLEGNDIQEGTIADEGLSDASSISSDDDMSSSD